MEGAMGGQQARVLEVGVLQIKPEAEARYRAAYQATLQTLTSRSGYLGHEWGRRVEAGPVTYALMVRWASLVDHEAFKASAEYPAFVGSIMDYLVAAPEFFHVDLEP